jgi:molybdopterin molybdotransferase
MTSTCCDQAPQNSLKNLDDAIAELKMMAGNMTGKSSSPHLQTEIVSLTKALNRILAVDIFLQINVPPADNSAVDGYALKLEDYIANQSMRISQRIPAGHAPKPLEENTVARIFTGAHIPKGANCVVMQENIILNDEQTHISISEALKTGQNIRPMGQDIQTGSCILNKGIVLTPQRLGLIASIGIAEISVYKPLKIAILSTGDELVEPGQAVKEGQIYNSNRYLLNGFLRSLNFEIMDFGVIPDNFNTTLAALQKAAAESDVVITTGGASVGEEDYVQSAIKTLGTVDFWKVAIKPGKPVMLGSIKDTPI